MGEVLQFGVLRNVGDVRTSSDSIYSATLTGKTEDDDPNTDLFFFTSALLILEPVNGSILTCTGIRSDPMTNSTTVIISGG